MFLGFSDRNIFGRSLFPTLPIGETRIFNLMPFDEFGIPFSGWSVARRLGGTYTGNLIEVRRSTDNALLNIGYNSENELDTATLTGFIGANSGFIRTIYDQTGAGNNFVQTTLANQPRIVNAGVVDTKNGKPAAFFDGTNDAMAVGSSTATYKWLTSPDIASNYMLAIAQFGTASNPNTIYGLCGNGPASANVGKFWTYEDRVIAGINDAYRTDTNRGVSGSQAVFNAIQNVITPNQLVSFASIFTNDSTIPAQYRDYGIINGVVKGNLNISTGGYSSANASFDLQLGTGGNNFAYLLGYISELMLYKRTAQDFANPVKIIDNQKKFYAIT
jgi:hypothetical protein